ncbi:MAG: hypothetical protein KUG80_09070 [Gammaproteobacteria bacterium]|nr:hypothetical protein [Gammaproteobacteria bacterium]
MNFDKLIKNAAKSYKNGDADALIKKSAKTADNLFNEFVPEKTRENDLVKDIKGAAEKILTGDSASTENNASDPLTDTLRQGVKSARKAAGHYADKINQDDSGKTSEQMADLAGDLLGSAEKLGKAFFSKRR